MPNRFEIVKDPTESWARETRRYTSSIRFFIREVFQEKESDIELWMKANAPWRDRTGNARRSLHAEISVSMEAYILSVLYNDDIYYDILLEYAHGGKYAIIAPTIDYWGPILLSEIAERIRNGRGSS